MAVTTFDGAFRGRRVLLTGHTGFKGSWLALWLQYLGAEISGLALGPDVTPNHWNLLGLDMPSNILDIRNAVALQQVIRRERPEIVFHLAAQPLVRRSYQSPLDTWSTNVMGTANLLEAIRDVDSVQAVVIITTDKCYQNKEWEWGYRESDRLGGHDPYSASKAATELLVASYRSSFFDGKAGPLIATARAGNVIGGGDWSDDRLIPDALRAAQSNQKLLVRSPHATRPWQHVLDSLSGYLLLSSELLAGNVQAATAWNFGPDHYGNRTVEWVLQRLKVAWPTLNWLVDIQPVAHETTLLQLDSSKARQRLEWQPAWNVERAVAETADWYKVYYESNDISSMHQLMSYIDDLKILQNSINQCPYPS